MLTTKQLLAADKHLAYIIDQCQDADIIKWSPTPESSEAYPFAHVVWYFPAPVDYTEVKLSELDKT